MLLQHLVADETALEVILDAPLSATTEFTIRAVGLIPVALICSHCPKIVATLSEITRCALRMLLVWFLTVALLAMLTNDGFLICCLLQYAVRLAPLHPLHSSYKDKQLTAAMHSYGA